MKKIIAVLLSFLCVFGTVSPVFAVDEVKAYDVSLLRVDAMYDYLNEVYLKDDSLAFDIDYCSPEDIEELTELAHYITDDVDGELNKARAIYYWIDANIKTSNGTNYSAIDVFRNLGGLCTGQAQLGSALCKLIGIRSAIVRGLKANCNYVSLEYAYNHAGGHEWVVAYCDGDWYLFDALWDMFGVNDKSKIAEQYFTSQIDGILAYTDGAFDNNYSEGKIVNTYYINGQYIGMQQGNITTNAGASLSVGGCVRFSKWYTNGYAVTSGTYFLWDVAPYVIRSNGTRVQSRFIEYNDTTYLLNDSAGIKMDESFTNNGLTDGRLNLHIGETVNIKEYYPDATYCKVDSGSDYISVEDGVLTANATGKASVWIVNRVGMALEVYVYGDVISSNELFQTLCDHDCYHCVNGKNYCDYCGICEEDVVIDEKVDEPVVEEPVIEETPIIEEPVEEETPVVEEPVVEKPAIEETPVEPTVKSEPVEVSTPTEIVPETVENQSQKDTSEEPVETTVATDEPEITIVLCTGMEDGQVASVEVQDGNATIKVNLNSNCKINILMNED